MKPEGRRQSPCYNLGMTLRAQPAEDLKVRTRRFAGEIVRAYQALPIKRVEVQVLGKQMLRSGTSVGANYCEASRARSRDEFVAKVELCSQEAAETQYWIELLQKECEVVDDRLPGLWFEANELIAIFVTMARNAKRSRNLNGRPGT